MNEKRSISKNMLLQFLYQGLILVIPLVLSPYLTRTLQENALGIYSYTNSIAYYFVILSMLGINRHGQRIISQCKEFTELRKVFWSLFSIHIIISLLCTILYMMFVTIFISDNAIIYFIQTFYVLSALFDITWLFYGLENFKSVVAKNAIVKIVECGLVFAFVKNPNNLWIYTLITTMSLLLGQIVMIPQAIKVVKPIRFSRKDMLQHIKPLLVFSISVIAASLYTVFDKTLLGLMNSKENVAFYEYSNKIINIPIVIIGVVGTVMFPRACKLASDGDIEGQKRYMEYSFLLTSIIGMGSIFGLLAVGTSFATFYYGESFKTCGPVIMVLSPLILIIGIGDIIRTQYMIPNHMDKQFNICIMLNALVNIVLSMSLIPVIGIYGAVIGTISAEVFGIVYQLVFCRKLINVKEILKNALPFAVIGAIMYLVLKLISSSFTNGVKELIVQFIIGIVVYGVLSVAYLALFRREIIRTVIKEIKGV